MTMITETIEPELKGAERQELSHLDYFRRKIEELRDRGLIAGDSFETISSEIRLRREAIDRHGVYRAQLGRARKLFGGSLRAERQPAYLYLGFAAFFLSYFGAYHFVRDLLLPIEGPPRQVLMWASRLPGPYRAINGLMFNLLLGILALIVSRRCKDERLALHCHYLGVPFSVAACACSGFEPRAAMICLSGYTVVYLLATRVFASPRVQYLAIASLAGAAYFGSTLLPAITLGQQALGAATIGLFCSLVVLLLRGCRLNRSGCRGLTVP